MFCEKNSPQKVYKKGSGIFLSNIKVKAIDQNIVFTDSPRIYSGDINTDTIEFSFDEVWDGYIKTAVFYKDINTPYFQLLKNNSCVIPHEVLSEAGKINVGVLGVLNDKVITSEVIVYEIGQGAITLIEYQPSPDIWQQVLSELNNIRRLSEHIKNNESNFMDEMEKLFNEYYKSLKDVAFDFMSLEDVDRICGGQYDELFDIYGTKSLSEEEILAILI